MVKKVKKRVVKKRKVAVAGKLPKGDMFLVRASDLKPYTPDGERKEERRTTPHIYKGTKKPVTIAIIALVLIIGLTSLIFFSSQFVGKAIHTAESAGTAVLSIAPGVNDEGKIVVEVIANPLNHALAYEAEISYFHSEFLDVTTTFNGVQVDPLGEVAEENINIITIRGFHAENFPENEQVVLATLLFDPSGAETDTFQLMGISMSNDNSIIPNYVAEDNLWVLSECEDADGDGADNCAPGAVGQLDNVAVDCAVDDPLRFPGNPDICDGIDNDCDDATLDGSGGVAPENSLQWGVCVASTQSCTDGAWVNDYAAVATYELAEVSCDNFDNNCNGEVDEQLTRPIGTNEGECSVGIETCSAGSWDVSQEAVAPTPELCDGLDNDCDGQVDGDGDGNAITQPAELLVGVCARNPPLVATCQNSLWVQPDYSAGVAGAYEAVENTMCDDGLDNDCDGLADGDDQDCVLCDQGVTQPCYTGADGTQSVGLCVAGTQTCNNNAWGVCGGEVTPVAEVCDGADNDCDGQVDEGLQCNIDSDGDGIGEGDVCPTSGSEGQVYSENTALYGCLAGDTNGGGCVNFQDVRIISRVVDLTCGSVANPAPDPLPDPLPEGDINGDGCVNFQDVRVISRAVDLSCRE
jgi:hypothetical protein